MEKDNQDEFSTEEKKPSSRGPGAGMLVPLVVVAIVGGLWMLWAASPAMTKIEYGEFWEQLEDKNVAEVTLYADRAIGRFKVPPELPSEATSSDAAKTKPGGKATTPATAEGANEHFAVARPAWQKDNTALGDALKISGSRYDNALQIDPTLM